MEPRLRTRARLLVLALGAATACTPPPPGIMAVRESTVTGTVRVVGSEPLTRVVVRTDDATIRIEGAQEPLLERAAGATVEITGDLDEEAGTMDVRTFTVTEVDGRPALDGVLFRDDEGLGLVDGEGRTHHLPDAPDALRDLVGARVWITGPLDAPQAWGVLLPTP